MGEQLPELAIEGTDGCGAILEAQHPIAEEVSGHQEPGQAIAAHVPVPINRPIQIVP